MYVGGVNPECSIDDLSVYMAALQVPAKPSDIAPLADTSTYKSFRVEVPTAKWDTAIKAKWPTGIKVRPFHEQSGIDVSGVLKLKLRGVKQHTGGARQSQQPFRPRRTTSSTGTFRRWIIG